MSELDNEIKRLADAAVDICSVPTPAIRHRGGLWLQGELENCFESHVFTEEQRIDFMVVVKIMLDVIFRDVAEDASDLGAQMEVGKTELAQLVRKAQEAAAESDYQEWMKD